MLKAILVDDEQHCLQTLSILLKEHCPNVEVIQKYSSAKKCLEELDKNIPDILFLDIEMPVMNGFQLLEQLTKIPFAIVFTTSYDQYAIKAIRFSALDYLLKPIDGKELVAAVSKVEEARQPALQEQFQMLLQQIHGTTERFKKVAVPTFDGYEMIPAEELVRCEASDNYTHLYLKSKEKIVACRTLKQIEEQLQHFQTFLRVHNSFIINVNEITRYVRGEGGYLTMSDGSVINVSRSRKQALMRLL